MGWTGSGKVQKPLGQRFWLSGSLTFETSHWEHLDLGIIMVAFGRTWCVRPVPLTRGPQHCGSIHWTPCMPAKSLQSGLTLRPYGLKPTSLLCPWNFPGKTTEVGCHFLFQGIFPTQGSNPCRLSLLHSLPLETLGKPVGLPGIVKEKVQLKKYTCNWITWLYGRN